MSRPSLAPVAVALALGALLAGCFGGGTGGPAADAPSGPGGVEFFDEATGGIHGVVVDESQLPVEAVVVRLGPGAETTLTDPEGAFLFPFLDPGRYRIGFERAGYLPTLQDVEVRPGESVSLTVRLFSGASSDAAYYTTLVQAGMDGCSVGYRFEDKPSVGISPNSLNYSYPACNLIGWAMPEVDNSIVRYDLGSLEHVTGFWSETTWRSTQALGSEMFLTWTFETVTAVHRNFARDLGPSPLGFPVPMETLWDQIANETLEVNCAVDDCVLFLWHSAGYTELVSHPYGVGVGLQQRFDDFVTLFYNMDLPSEFSVLEDE